MNIDVLDSTTSPTVIAFDKEAERLIDINLDEMINISKMENEDMKMQKNFQQPLRVDVVFESKPNNYKMNNKDTFLTTRRITKKNVSSQLSSSMSQTTTMTGQSTIVDNVATQTSNITPTESDYKGKKKLVSVLSMF